MGGDNIIPDSKGMVEFPLGGKMRRVSLKWVLAVTFKPVYNAEAFLDSLVENWQVLVISEDQPLHPGNLLWKPPKNGQLCPALPGYFVIPGFSRYVINHEGVVRIRKNGPYESYRNNKPDRFLHEKDVGRKGDVYYRGYDIRADDDHYTAIPTHRLMALAFLEYDYRVNSMTVNHRDGNKARNVLSNLEWNTYRENNKHAKETGLWNHFTAASIKDYWTGEIKEYRSISDAAKELGYKNCSTVLNYGTVQIHLPLRKRYGVRLKGDPEPFYDWSGDVLKDAWLQSEQRKKAIGCWGLDIETREMVVGGGPGDLARHFKMTKDEVATGLDSPYGYPVYGISFGYLADTRVVRDYTQDEIDAFRPRKGIIAAYRVYDENEASTIHIGAQAVADKIGCLRQQVDVRVGPKSSTRVWQYKGKRVVRLPP
jgi:hypothetical protein